MSTTTQLIARVDFVPFSTRDIEAACEFYGTTLDVAAARATLEERGVQFHGDTLDTGVCHMGFFADPDGNALMLHHRYAPRVTKS